MIVPGVNGGLPAQSTQTEMTTGQQQVPSSVGEQARPQAGPTGQGAGSKQASQPMDHNQVSKALQQMNQMLAGGGTKVVLDPKAPPNTLWLNVVDSTTGAVIERLPPEGLRQYAETASAKGLSLDLKL